MADSTIAIIPARGGSKGVSDKNLRHVGGIPLLVRTITALRHSSQVASVFVTTDSISIARLASAYDATVIMRPSNLSTDSASSETALMHAIEEIEKLGLQPTSILFAQCTSPFIETVEIDGVISLLGRYDSAFTVTKNHAFIWGLSEEGVAIGINHKSNERLPRQLLPIEFRETGALYAFKTDGFKAARHRFFGSIGMFEVPSIRSMEIDDLSDLSIANQLATISLNVPTPHILPNIKAVVLSSDGVAKNDLVVLNENGSEYDVCSTTDVQGMQKLKDAGFQLLILSKERNRVLSTCGIQLDIEVIQECDDKFVRLSEWLNKHHLLPDQVIYMGNDVSDRGCMDYVGLSVAPGDAHSAVDTVTMWKMSAKGGYGAISELSHKLLLHNSISLG
jgi:N-acylneuraminate cytidylyltransferase